MLRKLDKKEENYLPLRRFAHKNLYNEFYLSNLVQRKKLKVKKIGRNYYTTIEWFKEYLALHARDKKRKEYHKFLENLGKDLIKENKLASENILHAIKQLLPKADFFVWPSLKKASAPSFWLGFFIALIIALSSLVILNNKNLHENEQPGQVAGVEETGSSTVEIINDQ
jgi:hypothetical protein